MLQRILSGKELMGYIYGISSSVSGSNIEEEQCRDLKTKYMPKLSYYQNEGEPTPMERVEGEKPCQKVWGLIYWKRTT